MKIGQLSEVARTQVETIRFYEREGLLAEPKRTAGNYRIYDQTHLDRHDVGRDPGAAAFPGRPHRELLCGECSD